MTHPDPGAPVQTRQRLLALLGDAARSVDELATSLEITTGAVRIHLAALERDGLVELVGRRATTRRPAALYGLTALAERERSQAYLPLLKALLAELGTRVPETQLSRLLRRVGRRLAGPAAAGADRRARVEAAAEVLRSLGGSVRVEAREGKLRIQSNGCPIGEVVRDHPRACLAVEGLVSAITGEPVKEVCQRGERSKCGFVVGGS